ncbi:MAG TPA: PCYCGC motif-containing (lipo)protein [Nitriliruptorales bacterium]
MTDHPPSQTSRPWSALAVSVLALAAAGWLLTTGPGTGSTGPDTTGDDLAMLAVAPGGTVELASLPAVQQELYRAAAADPEGFEAVACYCGCESFLDHRNLLDCFVRPDSAWERHATGCAVCLAEARDVIDLRADGTPISEIVRLIDDRYGAITAPTS